MFSSTVCVVCKMLGTPEMNKIYTSWHSVGYKRVEKCISGRWHGMKCVAGNVRTKQCAGKCINSWHTRIV